MSSIRIEITKRKCQAFGNPRCADAAGNCFGKHHRKAGSSVDRQGASDQDRRTVQAAKSRPYRVIAVSDSAGQQIFPPPRK